MDSTDAAMMPTTSKTMSEAFMLESVERREKETTTDNLCHLSLELYFH